MPQASHNVFILAAPGISLRKEGRDWRQERKTNLSQLQVKLELYSSLSTFEDRHLVQVKQEDTDYDCLNRTYFKILLLLHKMVSLWALVSMARYSVLHTKSLYRHGMGHHLLKNPDLTCSQVKRYIGETGTQQTSWPSQRPKYFLDTKYQA